MKPKILILSRDSWNTSNNSGNTLSNLFQNWSTDRIAHLYCRDEIPNNNVCTKYFKISESLLFRKLLKKAKVAGLGFERKHGTIGENHVIELKNERAEKKIYDFFRDKRWHIFLWARELLWKLVNWKSNELKLFLEEFDPEIIYSPSHDSFYMHDLLYFVKKNTNAKIVYFHCDDLVTYRQYSLSPLFWINRFILRQYMNKSIKCADKNYCIIDEQAKVYKNIYNINFDLLYKTGTFKTMPSIKQNNNPLKIIYTGNVGHGRIASIIEIATALEKININGLKAKLYLYITNPIDEAVNTKLIRTKAVEIMGKVPYNEIPAILANADILVHVESFQKQQMLLTSLSFSTKLVDYFEAGKPIFALGWENAASIKYLKDNNIGILATSNKGVYDVLINAISNKKKLNLLGEKTWVFGEKHHNKDVFLKKFEDDLEQIIYSPVSQ